MIVFFLVKCHQDYFGEIIIYESKLNIQCNVLARQYWNATKRHDDNCLPINKVNNSGFVLKIDGKYQSNLCKEQLYDSRTYGKLVSLPYESHVYHYCMEIVKISIGRL